MGARLTRSNTGKWEKYATAEITRRLKEEAGAKEKWLQRDISKKLLQTYVDNVKLSYRENGVHEGSKATEINYANEQYKKQGSAHRHKLSYHHTGIFAESVHVITEGNKIKVVISDSRPYDDGTQPSKVYEWLVDGTSADPSKHYTFKSGKTKNGNSVYKTAPVYSTPRHLFEEHTYVQMRGYLESLLEKIRNGTYHTHDTKNS